MIPGLEGFLLPPDLVLWQWWPETCLMCGAWYMTSTPRLFCDKCLDDHKECWCRHEGV